MQMAPTHKKMVVMWSQHSNHANSMMKRNTRNTNVRTQVPRPYIGPSLWVDLKSRHVCFTLVRTWTFEMRTETHHSKWLTNSVRCVRALVFEFSSSSYEFDPWTFFFMYTAQYYHKLIENQCSNSPSILTKSRTSTLERRYGICNASDFWRYERWNSLSLQAWSIVSSKSFSSYGDEWKRRVQTFKWWEQDEKKKRSA